MALTFELIGSSCSARVVFHASLCFRWMDEWMEMEKGKGKGKGNGFQLLFG